MPPHSPSNRLHRLSYPILLATAIAGLLTLAAAAQDDGQQYRVINIRDEDNVTRHIQSWLDLAPDGRTLAVAPTQSFPFRLYDLQEGRITRTLDVGNWYAGARSTFSSSGRYLVLQQLFYLDMAPNKVRSVKFEVVDVASGASIFRAEDIYAAALSPDERILYTLGPNGLDVIDPVSGKRDPIRRLERLGHAVAVSTDGTRVAVAHRPTRAELAAMPSVRNDKDALKALEKVGNIVVIYDAATLTPVHTLNEPFDKVFRLVYSADGRDLWIHAKPHTRKGSAMDPRQSYVSIADAGTGGMRRTAFPSLSTYEPDFRISPDGRLFGIVSQGRKFMEIHLYERETGRMVDRFELSYRFADATPLKDGEFGADGRLSFTFLPDGRNIWMTFGTRLIEWTYAP
ncbi:MAG: hypothetical protein R2817_02615 [Flavobacteriales bacterium]